MGRANRTTGMGQGGSGQWGWAKVGWDDGDGLRWVRPTGAVTGTHHYRMTSRTPSSAREEGFQIFMYFVHYNHFSRLQID